MKLLILLGLILILAGTVFVASGVVIDIPLKEFQWSGAIMAFIATVVIHLQWVGDKNRKLLACSIRNNA